jgi:chromosomal replication initiation ATPase DnaA
MKKNKTRDEMQRLAERIYIAENELFALRTKLAVLQPFSGENVYAWHVEIIKIVAEEYNMCPEIMLCNLRNRELVIARNTCAWFLFNFYQLKLGTRKILAPISLTTLATLLGRNNHATVIHWLKSYENWIELYEDAKLRHETLIKKITQLEIKL